MSDDEITMLLVNDNGGLEAAKEKYTSLVMKICMGFLNNKDDAEEACADCFIRLWTTRRQIDAAKSSLKTYICMLARHAAIDKSRTLDKGEKLSLEENDIGLDVDYEDEAAKRINMQVIKKCVSEMPSPAREIFIDRYYFKMSVKDIAARYSLKPKKVENTLAREKKRLKSALLKGGIII